MQRQRKLLQPLPHRVPEAPGVILVLEANDDIVSIPHDDHVACSLTPSPALSPKVEAVVQVDVGEQRRDHRTLPRPHITDRHDPVFQDPRFEPFLDQTDSARVGNPVLQESNQPTLADLIERSRYRLPTSANSQTQ